MATRASLLKELEKVTSRLLALAAERDHAVAMAIKGGCTWAEVGSALGFSAQAAHKRFRYLRDDATTEETRREQPLPV